MVAYQLTASENHVIRTNLNSKQLGPDTIPNDPLNRDWVEYQAWLAAGNTPDPYVPPENALNTVPTTVKKSRKKAAKRTTR